VEIATVVRPGARRRDLHLVGVVMGAGASRAFAAKADQSMFDFADLRPLLDEADVPQFAALFEAEADADGLVSRDRVDAALQQAARDATEGDEPGDGEPGSGDGEPAYSDEEPGQSAEEPGRGDGEHARADGEHARDDDEDARDEEKAHEGQHDGDEHARAYAEEHWHEQEQKDDPPTSADDYDDAPKGDDYDAPMGYLDVPTDDYPEGPTAAGADEDRAYEGQWHEEHDAEAKGQWHDETEAKSGDPATQWVRVLGKLGAVQFFHNFATGQSEAEVMPAPATVGRREPESRAASGLRGDPGDRVVDTSPKNDRFRLRCPAAARTWAPWSSTTWRGSRARRAAASGRYCGCGLKRCA